MSAFPAIWQQMNHYNVGGVAARLKAITLYISKTVNGVYQQLILRSCKKMFS